MSELKEAIYKGNMIKAKAEVQAALDGGADIQDG